MSQEEVYRYLERVVLEEEFRGLVDRDVLASLAGFDLTEEEKSSLLRRDDSFVSLVLQAALKDDTDTGMAAHAASAPRRPTQPDDQKSARVGLAPDVYVRPINVYEVVSQFAQNYSPVSRPSPGPSPSPSVRPSGVRANIYHNIRQGSFRQSHPSNQATLAQGESASGVYTVQLGDTPGLIIVIPGHPASLPAQSASPPESSDYTPARYALLRGTYLTAIDELAKIIGATQGEERYGKILEMIRLLENI